MKAGHIKARKLKVFILPQNTIYPILYPYTPFDIVISPQISERLRWGEGEGSRSLPATTSSTTAGRLGKQIFPSILRRPWPSLQGRSSENRPHSNTVLLRCSFDESHRQPIFLLGGIPALAELIQVTFPHIDDQICRRRLLGVGGGQCAYMIMHWQPPDQRAGSR